jgi:uncharacterized protein (DUF111 family)
MELESVGYGAGSRDPAGVPNLLRVWIGQPVASSRASQLLQLETNIDDMNPELYGYVLERLLAAGARDVWFTPIQMKKNRPATMLSALFSPEMEHAIVETVLRETSTLGVRVQPVYRHEADREIYSFASTLLSLSPEYDLCRELALRHNLPIQEVYRRIESEARAALKTRSE